MPGFQDLLNRWLQVNLQGRKRNVRFPDDEELASQRDVQIRQVPSLSSSPKRRNSEAKESSAQSLEGSVAKLESGQSVGSYHGNAAPASTSGYASVASSRRSVRSADDEIHIKPPSSRVRRKTASASVSASASRHSYDTGNSASRRAEGGIRGRQRRGGLTRTNSHSDLLKDKYDAISRDALLQDQQRRMQLIEFAQQEQLAKMEAGTAAASSGSFFPDPAPSSSQSGRSSSIASSVNTIVHMNGDHSISRHPFHNTRSSPQTQKDCNAPSTGKLLSPFTISGSPLVRRESIAGSTSTTASSSKGWSAYGGHSNDLSGYHLTGVPESTEQAPAQLLHAAAADSELNLPQCEQCRELQTMLQLIQQDVEYLRSLITIQEDGSSDVQHGCVCREKRNGDAGTCPLHDVDPTWRDETLVQESAARLLEVTGRHKRQIEQLSRERARWQHEMQLKISKFALMCKNLNEESGIRKEDAVSLEKELGEAKSERNALIDEVESLRAKLDNYSMIEEENRALRDALRHRDESMLLSANDAVKKRDKIIECLSDRLEVATETLQKERQTNLQRRQIIFPGKLSTGKGNNRPESEETGLGIGELLNFL